MNPNFDLNLFRTFHLIFKHRSISKAASELGVSQPTVSKTLNKLRHLFNDPLFVYTSNEMQPTDFSNNIFSSVSDDIDLLESTIQDHKSFSPFQGEHIFKV